MGWRTQEAYEREARERWRELPLQTRAWGHVRTLLVVAIIAAFLLLIVWPAALDPVRAWLHLR